MTKTNENLKVKVENENNKDFYTKYTMKDLNTMEEYFFNKYSNEYSVYVGALYKTWCRIYAMLYTDISEDERRAYVEQLNVIENDINKRLEKCGSSARISLKAKINFDDMGNIWDTISTIE